MSSAPRARLYSLSYCRGWKGANHIPRLPLAGFLQDLWMRGVGGLMEGGEGERLLSQLLVMSLIGDSGSPNSSRGGRGDMRRLVLLRQLVLSSRLGGTTPVDSGKFSSLFFLQPFQHLNNQFPALNSLCEIQRGHLLIKLTGVTCTFSVIYLPRDPIYWEWPTMTYGQ